MKLSPSLLSADFGRLAEEARAVEGIASYLHFDVMDGHFVPNLTFGPPVVNALRRHSTLPLDIHLMIDRPALYAPRFEVGAEDVITFHVEAKDPPRRALEAIRGLGCRVGISLRPGTPLSAIVPYLPEVDWVLVMSVEPGFGGQAFRPEALDRIRNLRRLIGNRAITIAVDGGINADNVRQVVEAGAEVIVAGSAIYGKPDPAAAARELLRAADA
ncbi:TPA: ribulose-phosphate 3-epimerase [Candidatus Bipolaricaulota bacterium]|nr:ribulose-phosphate 3-epimerase [Candidatus Bipolaricaulota bacterium]HIQ00336.1 ribulose-phosphate 3-epimerase [Candidatus Bipolaricaulota bacterium]